MSNTKKPKYDPEYALHAAEDLAVRLELFDIFDSEPDRDEYQALVNLAWDIAYSLKKPDCN